MNNMEVLFDAILCWFEESFEDWGSIDDPDWIEHVCEGIGITEEEYRKIMELD